MIQFVKDHIGPPRFVAFLVILATATAIGWAPLGWTRAFMTGFDIAAVFFLIAMIPTLRTRDAKSMKRHAKEGDANRILLLLVSAIITAAVIVAVGFELTGEGRPNHPLVFATLVLAWILSNTVYALHYAFIYYVEDKIGGIDFPETPEPDYGDFIYFAFTVGMAFQPSDAEATTRRVRLTATFHAFTSFVFNIGVVAFAISTLSG